MFVSKCYKTHLQASLITKFYRGDTSGPPLKRVRTEKEQGEGEEEKEVASWLSGRGRP